MQGLQRRERYASNVLECVCCTYYEPCCASRVRVLSLCASSKNRIALSKNRRQVCIVLRSERVLQNVCGHSITVMMHHAGTQGFRVI